MIYTNRKVTVRNGVSTIDSPIILYRGDKEVDIKFEIIDIQFKFRGNNGNLIDNTKASFGQLAIQNPDGNDTFTDIAACEDGQVVFRITGEMIDELHEVGMYSFHIRLFDDDQTSRITIPHVQNGIEIKEPIVIEDDVNSINTVDDATVGYSMISESEEDIPVVDGKLQLTWSSGDVITAKKLNSMVEHANGIVDEEVFVVEIKDGNYTLTTQPRQYALISGLSELVMPEVNDFTEIHLYFNITDDAYVIFPEGKYKNSIEPQHTNSYELVCVYNTKEWIFEIIEYTKRSNGPEWLSMAVSDSGELVSSTEYLTSELISISPKLDFKIISVMTDGIRLYFYDENKQYMGCLGHQPDNIFSKKTTLYPMPKIEGAKYFRYRTDLTEGITMDNVAESIQIIRVKKVDDNAVPMQFRFNRTISSDGSDGSSDSKFILKNLYLENYYKYTIEFYADDSSIYFYDSNDRFISKYEVPDGKISIDTDAEFIPQRTKYIGLKANMVSTDGSRDTITPENVQDFVKVTREPQPSSNDIELDWLDNYNLDSSSGEPSANDNCCCTNNYITIDDVYDYCLTINPINSGFRIYEYDADKKMLRRSDDSACFYKFNERLSFGENTKYIRLKATKTEYSFEEVVNSIGLKRVQKDEGLLYSFGLISDVHIDNNHDGDFNDAALSDEDYMNALRFFEEEGANFIAYCGDMVIHNGSYEKDYIRVAECLKTSKLPNYVIKGNHDRSGSTEYFDTYVSPASYYQVNYGDDILIFISSGSSTHKGGGMTIGRVHLVKDTIANNPNQRIFIFQHYFFRGYGSGDGNGGIYGGTSIGDGTREEYPLAYKFMDAVIASPNVISCHGHSHCEFSMQDTCSHANMYHADGECWDVHVPSCAKPRYLVGDSLATGNGSSEGYIVKVYEDKIIFKALDLATNEYLPQYDQTVLLPSQPKEYSYIEDGLKLYIDADQAMTEQEIRDISGNETPISAVGLSVPTDGYLVFDDDVENYINCNFTPNTSAWTAEFYGKLLYTTSTEYLFSYGGSGAKLGIKITLGGGSVELRYGGDDFDILDIPGVAQKDLEYLLKDTTHKDDIHIIVSYDGTTLYVFINGVLILNEDKSPVDFSSYNDRFLYIGKHYDDMDDYPKMNLKLFRWYDGTALTSYQAFQNYLSVIKK